MIAVNTFKQTNIDLCDVEMVKNKFTFLKKIWKDLIEFNLTVWNNSNECLSKFNQCYYTSLVKFIFKEIG